MSTDLRPPDDLKFFCQLCPAMRVGAEAIVAHLQDAHGKGEPQRWPDGELVYDTSRVADEVFRST